MLGNNRKSNWVIDAVLFTAFTACFWMDLTGVAAHQWLGVGLFGLAIYHLLVHFHWVKAVSFRFFRRLKGTARLNFLVDLALFAGLTTILVTGLQISTWLALPYDRIRFAHHLHVQTAVLTMLALVLKIGLHGSWILQTPFFKPARLQIKIQNQPLPKPARLNPYNTGRRDFIKLMGITGGAALLSIAGVLDALKDQGTLPEPETVTTQMVVPAAEAASSSISTPAAVQKAQAALGSQAEASSPAGSSPQQAVSTSVASSAIEFTPSNSPSSCIIRCERACTYPGHCRRYLDQNGNGRCDNGECM